MKKGLLRPMPPSEQSAISSMARARKWLEEADKISIAELSTLP
jgi:hypothetical protein